MEDIILPIVLGTIVFGSVALTIFQRVLDHLHPPYLDDSHKSSDTARVYIYKKGKADGSYECFCFRKEDAQWHFVPNKGYIIAWVLSYIITLGCLMAVFMKLGTLSVKLAVIIFLGATVMFLWLALFDVFLAFKTLEKLLAEEM
ncbi:MAG: hypothetical protein IKR73_01340 [Oscillospiraceae bacterium]|nr:hypothetical protein [Oscillospiraceae bacterium]